MKPITIYPMSALAGAAIAALTFLALGAQSPVAGSLGHWGPGPVDIYYPPVPVSSLEFFPGQACAAQATIADVVTVRLGEKLVPMANTGNGGYSVLRWPLEDLDGNGSYNPIRQVGVSPWGVPTTLLGPGQYVFATSFEVNCTYSPSRDPEGVFGYRIRSQ